MAKRLSPKKRGGCLRPLLILLLALLALYGFFRWSNDSLQVHEETLSVPALPAEFDGLRIAHLTDRHGKEFGENNVRLLTAVENAAPDLIFVTGDIIDRESQYDTIEPLARGLVSIAPTYYVTGNHEWALHLVPELKELLEDCGVRVLTNEFDLFTRNGSTLAIAGLDDPNGPADQKTGEELRAEIDADCTLLLSHRDTVDTYAAWDYDVVFCGHGHGGLIRIPFLNQGLVGHRHTLFPKYSGGVYPTEDGGLCYVSRGLGNNTTPIHTFRLFNRPDLPILTLRAS